MSSTRISFVGDVMLGRLVGRKYSEMPYKIVSDDVIAKTKESDLVIANLEGPLPGASKDESDHMRFNGNADCLDQLKWINLFSLCNNHINDCGYLGMDESIEHLEAKSFKHTGLFKEQYVPYLFEKNGKKFAIITLTDIINHEVGEDSPWRLLRMEDSSLSYIEEYDRKGYYVILYAHVGMLFTRFPNPVTRDYLHKCVDSGADLIVTVHSHCLGGYEKYKGKLIFHSLGDFVMDGSSYRRRQACLLNVNIADDDDVKWEMIPTEIDNNLQTVLSKRAEKSQKSWLEVATKLEKNDSNYSEFYSGQYKKEIISHSLSTIKFLIDTRGLIGAFKLILKRGEEVNRTVKWASSDRSNVRNDSDALEMKKIYKDKDLF